MAKVLVVDDSFLMRAILKNFITREGHEVIEANEGKDAIEKYKTENPSMVFMDILMPNGMDGLTAVKEIRKINPDSKIVMITSVSEQKEFYEAKRIGVNGYISKPFSKEEITNALKDNL